MAINHIGDRKHLTLDDRIRIETLIEQGANSPGSLKNWQSLLPLSLKKYAVIVSLSLIIMTPLTGEDLNAFFMRTATSRDCAETTPALFSALAAGAGAVLYIAPVFREDSATGSLSHPMYAMPL